MLKVNSFSFKNSKIVHVFENFRQEFYFIHSVLFIFQMLMDPMGGIVMTNDGNAILREVISNFVLFHEIFKDFLCLLDRFKFNIRQQSR